MEIDKMGEKADFAVFGDRGIHGVAPCFQYGHAGVRRVGFAGDDHGLFRPDRIGGQRVKIERKKKSE